MEENKATTVQFNVGGQLYQVARSLLEQYPSTMLYCDAAERWQTDSQATIFIEGDGERFRYCLDYMRRQRVHLPMTIPKAAVLADLDYYGFPDVDPSLVHGNSLIDEVAESHAMELKRAYVLFASECFSTYVRTGRWTISISQEQVNMKPLLDLTLSGMPPTGWNILDDCLAIYGLYVSYRNFWPSQVTLGPLPSKEVTSM